jgi:hypothetical protein
MGISRKALTVREERRIRRRAEEIEGRGGEETLEHILVGRDKDTSNFHSWAIGHGDTVNCTLSVKSRLSVHHSTLSMHQIPGPIIPFPIKELSST